jgi:ferrous iron transport protein A
MLQVSFNSRGTRAQSRIHTLADLRPGEEGVLDRLDVPEDIARRLMELGFLPGHAIVRGYSAPGGDPRVFRVDGSEVALRRETASRLHLRRLEPPAGAPDRVS